MNEFVRASELYDARRGLVLPHPASGATDEEVRQAIEDVESGGMGL